MWTRAITSLGCHSKKTCDPSLSCLNCHSPVTATEKCDLTGHIPYGQMPSLAPEFA